MQGNQNMSKITGPLFKWFGSKWSSSKTLPSPEKDELFEPFAGGAGYSLRHYTKRVTICESNPHLYALWNWLINDATESAIREIPTNLPEKTDIRTLGLSQGQMLLIKNWQRTNNVGNCWTISPWGNKPGQWTENTRARVASEFHHISHWNVLPDAFDTMKTYANNDASWFVDPPYQFNYQYGGKVFDYNNLAQLIHNIKGQVVVCEAVCQKTQKVPMWLSFEFFGNRVTSRRKEGENHHSKELIYTR